MAFDDILLEAEDRMSKAEQHLTHELSSVRTGKASPGLIENVQVEVCGSTMRLRELASITTPEPRMLLVQPWDTGTATAIEKATQKANLGLNPASQGKLIRIALPDLSTERRQEFVKAIKKMAEDSRVAVRHIRRDTLEALKTAAKGGGVTEDEQETAEKEVQKLTDQYIAKLDAHVLHKEKEILTV